MPALIYYHEINMGYGLRVQSKRAKEIESAFPSTLVCRFHQAETEPMKPFPELLSIKNSYVYIPLSETFAFP